MWRVASVALTIFLIFAVSPSEAVSLAPKVDEVCATTPMAPGTHSKINPRRLVGFLLKTHGINDYDLDTNGNDIGFETKIAAIVNYDKFCTPSQHCSEQTSSKLSEAAFSLIEFLRRNSRPVPADQSGFEVTPPLGEELNAARLRAFLQGDPGSYRVTCIAAPQKPAQPAPSEVQQNIAKVLSSVLVRNKVTDLNVPNTDKKFDALNSASVTFSSDYIAHTQTITADGVIGYRFQDSPLGDYSTPIPFLSYNIKQINGSGKGKSPNIGNVGGGLLGDFNFPIQGYYQNLQLFGQYIHSYVTDTDLVTGNLVYTPDFLFPGVGIAYNPNDGPVSFLLKPQLKFLYGDVLHAGTNPNLASTRNYSRGGGRVELWIFGEQGVLKNFSFDSSFEYLKVWLGPFDAIWRWENTLAYNFPGQQNWSLQFKYADGRNLDTLEREKVFTMGIGYKQ